MKRFTESDGKGNWWLEGVEKEHLLSSWATAKEREILCGALYKLKDYEETGLWPSEVQELKEATRWRKPQWELPPGDVNVLAVVSGRSKNTTFHKAFVLATYYRDESEWDIDGWPDFVGTIEAWRPLPEVKG